MKILYLIPGMGGGGGAERSLATMVPFWRDHLDLHIVTFSPRDHLGDDLRAGGAQLTNLGPLGPAALTRALVGLLREESYDLVHTTLFDADVVGRLAATLVHVPVSTSLVNVNYTPSQMRIPGRSTSKLLAAQLVDAASARTVSRFHALTEHVADVMARRLLIRRSKIDVIPRGRDRASLGERTEERRAAARRALGVGDEPLVVATARHEWQKGLDVLVEAAPIVLREIPDARFLIGGRAGPQTELLEETVAHLGLAGRISFMGPRDDVPELMCAADVFCVPSRWEGFGSILVEAMALGVPTVASDIGPIQEVDGGSGWLQLVRPEHPASLAKGIVESLVDRRAAERRGARGPIRFQHQFTAELVAGRMLGFFERAAATSRSSSSTVSIGGTWPAHS